MGALLRTLLSRSLFAVVLAGATSLSMAQMYPPGFIPPPPRIYIPMPSQYQVGPQAQMYGQVAGAFGVNREGQVAAQCVGQFGVTYAGAGCVAGRLTVDELNKCFSDGFGGRGCFGNNNTLIRMIRSNVDAAQREQGFANQAVRVWTGVSPRDIQERGILGGDNSEARKACNGVAGLFGGSC